MENKYILLWLEGPLQSWGHDSVFGRRDTLPFPTKSGILGLICTALGAGGEQQKLLKDFADMDLQIYIYSLNCNKQPLLKDFQMVGGNYDTSNSWENLFVPKTQKGKNPSNTNGSKLTYRYYLQDMAFAVALQTPAEHLKKISDALQNPVWGLYLGRKTCIPTEFIYQETFESAEDAFLKASKLATKNNKYLTAKILQGTHDGIKFSLQDEPIQFGSNKLYKERSVTLIYNKK